VRRRLLRHPPLYWTLAGALALLTALVVGGLVARADAARRRWGALEPVAVATRTLHAGDAVAAADLRIQPWPVGLAPDGIVADVAPGTVVTATILAGEPFVRDRLAPTGLSAAAALLPAGTRALAVPAPAGLPLRVGDRVDVLATFDPAAAPDHDPSFAVAENAVVVAVADQAVTVAVAEADAARVAFALAAGTVTLALRGD
jgi:Flp pilus assembly protein CpaB